MNPHQKKHFIFKYAILNVKKYFIRDNMSKI